MSRTVKGVDLARSVRKPLPPPSKIHRKKNEDEPRIPFCWQCGEEHTKEELCAE